MTGQGLLIAFGVLALLGVASLFTSGGGSRTSGADRSVRRVERMGGSAMRTLISTSVVVGIQWAVLAHSTDPRVWAVVLGVPALFAGATVARLLAITDVMHTTNRGGHR
ncbi:hypothetical protein [Pseudonocardia sp. ICBG1142]|uniref:hypothetical protein n=1 Tax=Pseudonocardia sp. ICBG1142 TaxID=2846760 RepID=UPI001CF66289|nr:hypothetical protein [Pseudonocardia sp. ICBG1142]